MRRNHIGDLVFPPALKSRVLCVKEPDASIWLSGRIDKAFVYPRVGIVYTVRSSVRSSLQDPLPLSSGIYLVEVVNKLITLRQGTSIEPFFPCECFTAYGSRP